MTEEALVNWKSPRFVPSAVQRAALSYQLRATAGSAIPLITDEWLNSFLQEARLPSAAQQTMNLIRIVGDHLRENGEGYEFDDPPDAARIGAFNPDRLHELRDELVEEGSLKVLSAGAAMITGNASFVAPASYGLSLRGWSRYDEEAQGRLAAHYGFIALKFGDTALEQLIATNIKPVVKREIGYDVVDMRNVARAGIIDNILRQQIRDAAFVLVDLTHDNAGAYWEAGYAEGLGKPVIYLCEASKFDRAKTHFDTNHCTTVMWTAGGTPEFQAELIATLRRSLNLFPRSDHP